MAARAGAGLTTIAVAEIALPVYAAALTSTMVKPIAGLDTFNAMLQDQRLSALLIGPGRRNSLTGSCHVSDWSANGTRCRCAHGI